MVNLFKIGSKKYFRIVILSILLISSIAALSIAIISRTEPPIPKEDQATEKIPEVEIVKAGEVDTYTSTIAQIKNKNELTIKALGPGVISQIDIKEGDTIEKEAKIYRISENYTGDNSIDTQIEIAEKQIEKIKENKNAIKNQYNDKKNLTDETYEDFIATLELNKAKVKSLEEQIDITLQLKDNVDDLIDDYEDFENEIEDYYQDMDQDFLAEQGVLQNQTAVNNFKTASKQYDSTILSLKDQLDQLKYITSSNYPGSQIAEINRDLAIEQLKLQQDMIDIDLELAELNLELTKFQKELYTLRSPIAGTVEKLFINEGDLVNPGQAIVVISGKKQFILSALVTSNLVSKIDTNQNARIFQEEEEYSANIDFVSSTPVENGFYEILLKPESKLASKLISGNSIRIELILKTEQETDEEAADYIYIPVDTVFKTNTVSYVLIAQNGIAIQKEVKTGDLVGDHIRILEGLNPGDMIIKDRRAIPNQKIIIQQSAEDQE